MNNNHHITGVSVHEGEDGWHVVICFECSDWIQVGPTYETEAEAMRAYSSIVTTPNVLN